MTSDTTNAIRNSQNRTFAIPAAAPAMPVKPRIAATMATMKNPIAQLSIEPPTVEWTTLELANSVPMLRCRDRLGEQILGLALRLCRFRVAAIVLGRRAVERGIERPVEGRLAVWRHQAEGAQVVLGHFAQRPEPFEKAGEMGDSLRVRAKARRCRIEEAAALHARHALGDERECAGYVADVHLLFPLL